MNWFYYLAEANLYLSIFYLCYCGFLKNETHYTLNRIYLLVSCMVSFVLPLIQVGALKPVATFNTDVMAAATAPTIIIAKTINRPAAISIQVTQHFTLQDGLLYVYLLGTVAVLVLLIIKLFQLFKLTRTKSVVPKDQYKMVIITGTDTAFSFFNYLFISENALKATTIIRHELVHIRQKHSFDIMLLEFFKIVNWFNPLIYLLQNSLKATHEYIADQQTISNETGADAYADLLVNSAYGVGGLSITHSFFNYNLLKRRLIMLHKKPSGNLARLKYLIAVPLCAALLCASTLAFSKSYGWIDLAPGHESSLKTGNLSSKDTAHYNNQFTKKGYKYQETGYLVNNKADFRVIIIEKDGTQKSYFKNSATPAEIKLLKEKYGYNFPTMAIFNRLPPPPPAPTGPQAPAVDKRPPPPPPAPPHKLGKAGKVHGSNDKMVNIEINNSASPHPPAEFMLSGIDSSKTNPGGKEFKSELYWQSDNEGRPLPLMVVNGVKYSLKAKLKPGERIYINKAALATYYSPGDAEATKKWGKDAVNGVFEMHGHPEMTIR